MKILFIATKAPWPPNDGGRLLVFETLRQLAARGHSITLVAPLARDAARSQIEEALAPFCRPRLVVAAPRPALTALLLARLTGGALSVVRHSLPKARRVVERLLAEDAFDVVHVEQLQAFAQAAPALSRGGPVVLRAQNVESDLWAQTAELRRFGFLARREARRLARAEAAAVRGAHATVALTAEDAEHLARLAPEAPRPRTVRVPFAVELPPAEASLPGDPPVVILGSAGWLPNADGIRFFLDEVWPRVRRERPAARLHLFGAGEAATGVEIHPAPYESRDAFVPGSLLAVPLRIASGVRMKILEAWARGIPVVATPRAARGLDATDGRELLIAPDATAFAAAILRLVNEPRLAAALVRGGRQALAKRHDPARVTAELAAIYEEFGRDPVCG